MVSGRFGSALRFPAKSSMVNAGNQPLLQPANLTLLAWIRAGSPPSQVQAIAAQGASGGCSHASYALYTGGSLDTVGLRFYIWNGSQTVVSPAAGNAIWDGAWHLAVGTYDGSRVRLYVDGNEVGAGTAGSGPIGYGLANNNFA
ncbi:MAG TPA: LamG-like jellyroll fold domain-containing protein, partial [Solirubrobacteraceae bacterium]|nr:LamG-like jellyroll fold domain-containing protein [Solirubrobacteraceae bacterium]